MGVAFAGEKQIWVSEGNTGRVRLIDAETGDRRALGRFQCGGCPRFVRRRPSLRRTRNILYVADQANFRVLAIDAKKGRIFSSCRRGSAAVRLRNGAGRQQNLRDERGCFSILRQFPAQADAVSGRRSASGFRPKSPTGGRRFWERGPRCVARIQFRLRCRCLRSRGDEGNRIHPHRPAFQSGTSGGSSPSGVLARRLTIYVANAHDDSITIIDAKTGQVQAEIQLPFRGWNSCAESCRSAWPSTLRQTGCLSPKRVSMPSE